MNPFLRKLRPLSRAIVCLSLLLILYGYAVRALQLYFFWESLTIGWPLLLVGGIFCLYDLHRDKRRNNKKSIGEKIGIGLLVSLLAGEVILFAVVSYSDACAAARKYVPGSPWLKEAVGNVRVIEVCPEGSIAESRRAGVVTGEAELSFTVKGDKAFADIVLYLKKTADSDWKVIGHE